LFYKNAKPIIMQKPIYTMLFICLFGFVNAQIQPQSGIVDITSYRNHKEIYSIPVSNAAPFLSYALTWQSEAQALRIRFSPDGITWGDWQPVHLDGHFEPEDERRVSELYFTNKNDQFFQISGLANQIQVHFYSPDATPELASQTPLQPRSDDCMCAQPGFQARENWCPGGNCPPNPEPEATETTHLIVHHSASANTADDWAAVVRSFWNFHVNINGWSDIGYNWLIDPNGVVYEGRGDGIQGAHFCGANSGTTGICVIGDFTNIEPTEAATNTLIEMLAWKSCDRSLDPLGEAFHASSQLQLKNISGHRDGCNTACPGDAFYPTLPSIRLAVAEYIGENCAVATKTTENLKLEHFRLSPNPAREQLQVHLKTELRGRFRIAVQNAIGETLQTGEFQKEQPVWQQNLDISNLISGVYWLSIQHEEGVASRKFVKQ
jgi:hypothetical protein